MRVPAAGSPVRVGRRLIAVDTESQTHWLACDPVGWQPIAAPTPTNLSGQPLSAAGVYAHIATQRLTSKAATAARPRDRHEGSRLDAERSRSRHKYTVTAQIAVNAEADLADPFARFAVFRALADQLTAAPLEVDTPFGTATAQIVMVTAVA